jgi:hypothetical protein
VKLSPFGTVAITGLLYQPQMVDNGDCGAIGGMKVGRGNWSTRRKPAPMPLCPPQIQHNLTRALTRAVMVVGGQRLTAWAMARPSLGVTGGSLISWAIYYFQTVELRLSSHIVKWEQRNRSLHYCCCQTRNLKKVRKVSNTFMTILRFSTDIWVGDRWPRVAEKLNRRKVFISVHLFQKINVNVERLIFVTSWRPKHIENNLEICETGKSGCKKKKKTLEALLLHRFRHSAALSVKKRILRALRLRFCDMWHRVVRQSDNLKMAVAASLKYFAPSFKLHCFMPQKT